MREKRKNERKRRKERKILHVLCFNPNQNRKTSKKERKKERKEAREKERKTGKKRGQRKGINCEDYVDYDGIVISNSHVGPFALLAFHLLERGEH